MKATQKRKTTKGNKPFPTPKNEIKEPEVIRELKMSDDAQTKVPKIIKIPFNEDTKINEYPIVDDQPTIYQSNCCIEECKEWGTTVQLTKWVNETGYEIILCNKSGGFQHLSITKEELSLVTKMAKRLDNI